MGKIALLDKNTIDKIAAGEVVERPASVVKELTENAIDAGANMITVELKEGGSGLIRITDNGSGIASDDVKTAFLRHSTSKIRTVEDLLTAGSLGFRGEALSSISAVAQVELITKTKDAFVGTRYQIDGGIEQAMESAGCPDGTTFLIRNLFYNVPARRKFLKSAMSEAGLCSELMQRMALSRPEIAYKFINNGKIVLQTSGNGNLKEVIYQIYGREITANLLEVNHIEESAGISVRGFIGKPVVSRGNRNYENYFINGRYIKSSVVSKAIEEAYRSYMMQHKYPFTALHISMDTAMIDVNVHPTKLEVRFSDSEAVYYAVYHGVRDALAGKNMIPQVGFGKEEKSTKVELPKRDTKPEQFETARMAQQTVVKPVGGNTVSSAENVVKPAGNPVKSTVGCVTRPVEPVKTTAANPVITSVFREEKAPYEVKKSDNNFDDSTKVDTGSFEADLLSFQDKSEPQERKFPDVKVPDEKVKAEKPDNEPEVKVQEVKSEEPKKEEQPVYIQEQMELPNLLSDENKKEYRIVGQLFATYWLIEMDGQLFMIDQHAAHEKILFEQTMKRIREKDMLTQQIAPPYIASLSLREEEVLQAQAEVLKRLGFEFEHFGGRDYKVTGVPADLCGLTGGELFMQLLDELVAEKLHGSPEVLVEKVASMSCKAAVKGNMVLSEQEAKAMIDLLLTLDNPYHCPHGRPTTISMTKQEIEKKFKRIV
ncbi:MAG: DNA mismatch repair endonuclease MutL [Lachnospiraceae bacterium]|nr:DNA mismatch repair endonuclease MutL [Lachnospiraceae bacterium]